MYDQTPVPVDRLIETFHKAARRVPAYRTLLHESGIQSEDVRMMGDFVRLPILDKRNTFQRFRMHELSLDGDLGPPECILTSSGHSGAFSFGLFDRGSADVATRQIDDVLDAIFKVKTRSALLLNCLPMGVMLYSDHCTLGATSVRPDMACALVEAFGAYYDQIILVGETAFIKHLLELGIQRGVDWTEILVHVILGEEPVAENGRKYIEGILGATAGDTATGLVISSMGIGELGLNLFFEVPPASPIILLRRALHENNRLRREVLGWDAAIAPSVFTYDSSNMYVEFVEGRLVITTLDPTRRIPLIRYASGDEGGFLHLSENVRSVLESAGVRCDVLRQLPLVMIRGRGEFAMAGEGRVFPEQVKEGIYQDPELAKRTTANFRLTSGRPKAGLRIQLAPGVEPTDGITESFAAAISRYVTCPLDITCEPYACFANGMALDYERKFDYLGRRDHSRGGRLLDW